METPLHYQATVSPHGAVGLRVASQDDAAYGEAGTVSAALLTQFERSMFAGLTELVSSDCSSRLPISLQYWRDVAQRYFQSLCRQSAGVTNDWLSPEAPYAIALDTLVELAPPMPGLEYVTAAMLRSLWSGLDEYTRGRTKDTKGGLTSYLRLLRPDWNLVGRVTFHLAENKKNPEKPFAFLATYTEGKTTAGSIQHIPLGEALKRSISARDLKQLDVLLSPVSRAAKETPLIAELLESRALFAPQAWGIARAFEFLSSVPKLEQSGVIVRVPNWWNASKPPRPQVSVRIGSKNTSTLGGNALDLSVGVSIDGEPLNESELRELMSAREGMTLLRGKWVQVDPQQLQSALNQWQLLEQEHVRGVGFLEGLRMLSGVSLGGVEIDDEASSWTRLEPGPWLAEMLQTLKDPSGHIDLDPEQHLNAKLRPYQADGVRWLWFATRLGLGCCLADDMGLGKTIQVIALLLQLKLSETNLKQDDKRPTLLILPTSLLGNWQREVERFAPDLTMFVAHRSVNDASLLKRVAENPAQELADVDLVVTTYGLARRETWLAEMNWRLVILDEAQAIKNAGAAQTKAIKKIPCGGRIVLTGTPVENHLGDLWSLFDFCSPGLLGTAKQFQKFVKADDAESLSRRLTSVRKLVRPYVLRRMKTDPTVAPDLPNKTEMRVDCGLTPTQAALYRTVTDELAAAVDIATGIQRRGMVLAALMQLKQICNHPSLFLKQSEFDAAASGKYAELRSICQTLVEKQEKMLVFTQFQSMCDPLAAFLAGVFGRSGLVLTGKTTAARRGKLVEEFQLESGPPFFVVSVKAGGTGLNLTQASHVVHFDRWWNPAVEDQATDRAFRIGQKRNVIVHKFVCRGTLEEKIDEMIHSKKAISRELFSGESEIQLTEMSNDELVKFVSLDINKAAV